MLVEIEPEIEAVEIQSEWDGEEYIDEIVRFPDHIGVTLDLLAASNGIISVEGRWLDIVVSNAKARYFIRSLEDHGVLNCELVESERLEDAS